MAYKRYIKRNGKVYGPYIYHSKKVNGKVISNYVGKDDGKVKKIWEKSHKKKNFHKSFLFIGVFSIIFISLIAFFIGLNLTGEVSRDIFENNISSVESNIFIKEVIIKDSVSEIEVNVTTTKQKVMLNQPVKWKKNIKLSKESNISIEIPVISENISIVRIANLSEVLNETIINETIVEDANESILNGTIREELNETIVEEIDKFIENKTEINITIEVVNESVLNETIVEKNNIIVTNGTKKEKEVKEKKEKELEEDNENEDRKEEKEKKSVNKTIKKSVDGIEEIIEAESDLIEEILEEAEIKEEVIIDINGNVVFEGYDLESSSVITSYIKKMLKLTGFFVVDDAEIGEKIIVDVDESVKEVEIEYETPAPTAIEENTEKGKKITIIGPDEVHYENILAYTFVEPEAKMEEVKLYWITGGSRLEVQIDKYDLNNNSLVDFIEWEVPSLSNQTYELIIEITKAEHLDLNRSFVSDIFEEVRKLDGIFSEVIPNGDYVRVTFEVELTSSNDITIFPRTVSGNPKIEVYEINDNDLIAEFTSLDSGEYNKVFLTNLVGVQDTFDLKILNGDVEFDHIVDPAPNINFELPTLVNATSTLNTNISINVSINNTLALDDVKFNWDGTNYTLYNDSLVLMYNFDSVSSIRENDTHVVDLSLYGNNGTVSGGYYGKVINPGFEAGSGVDATSWTESADADRATDLTYTGSASMKYVTPTSAQATTQSSVVVRANTDYVLSGWMYNNLTEGGNAYIDLNDIAEECNAVSTKGNDAWEYVSCSFTTGSSTTSVQVRLVTDGNGANTEDVWFDDVKIETKGRFDESMEFDGTDDYVIVAETSRLDQDTEFTVASWIYPTEWPEAGDLWINNILCDEEEAVDTTICFRIGSQGLESLKQKLAINIHNDSDNDFESASDLVLNKWQYVATTYDGINVRFYIDGRLDRTQAFNGNPTQSNNNWYVGTSASLSRKYTGSIDEIRLWNRTLSAAEINQSYMSNLRKVDSNEWELNITQQKTPKVGLTDATYIYQTYATDSVGGTNATDTRYVTIDTTAPNFTKTQVNTTTAGVTANFSTFVFDLNTLNPNGQFIFSINQSGAWVNDSAKNFTTTGEWANVTKVLNSTVGAIVGYQWYLYDHLQNTNHTISHTTTAFKLTTTDTTSPTSSFGINPVDNSNESSSTVVFDFKSTDTIDISYLRLYGNWTGSWHANYTNTSYTSGKYLNITINNIPEGKYVWGVFSNDSAGNINWTSTNKTFTIDTTSPTLSIHNPANQTYTVVQTDLKYNVADNIELSVCRYSLNDLVTNTTIACGTNVTSLTSDQGQNTWIVYANDTAGNSVTSEISFYVSTPAVESSTTTSSGGGGGTTTVVTPLDLEIDPTELNINLEVNTNVEKIIKITNKGSSTIAFSVTQENLGGMILFNETSIQLKSGESKNLNVVFVALNETGIFTGKIKIKNEEVLVSLNIKTKLILFDSNIVVLNDNYLVSRGDKLKTKVTLIPLGDEDRLDVTLNFVIKDYNDKVYLTKSDTLLVEERMDVERDFDTGVLPLGEYVVGLELVYINGVAPSSAHFEIVEKTSKSFRSFLSFIVFFMIISIIMLFIILLSIVLKHELQRRD